MAWEKKFLCTAVFFSCYESAAKQKAWLARVDGVAMKGKKDEERCNKVECKVVQDAALHTSTRSI